MGCNTYTCLATLFLLGHLCNVAHSELKLVNVLFRHGDRTPISHYQSDPYKDAKYWSEKPGQLTNIGKEMEYNLGVWLRKRYKNLVSAKFDTDEISVRSTNLDRTLMSAQCVMGAFYYPEEDQRFNKSIPWMPSPIHTAPQGADLLMNVDAACPRIKDELEIAKTIPEVLQYLSEYHDVFVYMTKYAGQKVSTFLEADYVFDTVYIEKLNNFSLPKWTDSIFDKMHEMSAISFKMGTITPMLKRLRAGPLISKLLKDMENKVKVGDKEKNMYIYSGHDSTIATMLNSFGVFDMHAPPYASTIMWELHHTPEKGNFVRMYYQNDTTMVRKPHLLVIPGCSKDCPLTKLRTLVTPVISDNWNNECNRPDPRRDQYYIVGLAVCGSGLILALLIIAVLVWRRPSSKTRYQVLPGEVDER